MRKKQTTYLDGRATTYYEIQVRFKVGPRVVSDAIKKYGRRLTSLMFQKAQKKIKFGPQKTANDDRSPGWLERREFPNAGMNGFQKVERDSFTGYDSAGCAVYTGAKS